MQFANEKAITLDFLHFLFFHKIAVCMRDHVRANACDVWSLSLLNSPRSEDSSNSSSSENRKKKQKKYGCAGGASNANSKLYGIKSVMTLLIMLMQSSAIVRLWLINVSVVDCVRGMPMHDSPWFHFSGLSLRGTWSARTKQFNILYWMNEWTTEQVKENECEIPLIALSMSSANGRTHQNQVDLIKPNAVLNIRLWDYFIDACACASSYLFLFGFFRFRCGARDRQSDEREWQSRCVCTLACVSRMTFSAHEAKKYYVSRRLRHQRWLSCFGLLCLWVCAHSNVFFLSLSIRCRRTE